MRRLLFILTALVLSLTGRAQTIISHVTQDTVWTEDGNPYLLQNDISVASSATLTVMPGVIVYGDKNKLITVFGKVKLLGTVSDSIFFTVPPIQSDPDLHNFMGIKIMANASAEVAFVSASYAKRFLDFRNNSTGNITHSVLRFNKTGINSDSLSKISIKNSRLISNLQGIDSIYVSTVAKTDFHANYFGVNYSNGTYFDSCTFHKNSEKALVGKYGKVYRSTFTSNNIALEYSLTNNLGIYQPSILRENRLENNVIGFKVVGGIPTAEFQNNYFCDNTLYSVYNSTVYSPSLALNCWCLKDSAQIRKGIYDRYTNIEKGVVTLLPFSKNCEGFLPRYTISGTVVSSAPLHQLWVYKSTHGKDTLRRKEYVSNTFMITALDTGTYKLMAIALNADSSPSASFNPTFYVKKTTIAKAEPLLLDTDIYDVDLELLPSESFASSSFAYLKWNVPASEKFVVQLENEQGVVYWQSAQGQSQLKVPVSSSTLSLRLWGKDGEALSPSVRLQPEETYVLTLQNQNVVVGHAPGISERSQLSEARVFPTKLESVLTIHLPPSSSAKAHFYNGQGSEVFSSFLAQEETKIDVSSWPSGIYVLHLLGEQNKVLFTLVK